MQYVYLIKSGEFYKIGIASDPASRLAQLQTGNPQELEIFTCYGFDDAQPVEKALHQTFKNSRHFLEWFKLSDKDVIKFEDICRLLGGQVAIEYAGQASNSQIEEAEEIAELPEGGKWDFQSMFADGWRMELVNENGKPRNWMWRRGSRENRKSLYGGSLGSLPHPIEEMRRIYGNPE